MIWNLIDWVGFIISWTIVGLMLIAAGRWAGKAEPNENHVLNGCSAIVVVVICLWAVWRSGQGL